MRADYKVSAWQVEASVYFSEELFEISYLKDATEDVRTFKKIHGFTRVLPQLPSSLSFCNGISKHRVFWLRYNSSFLHIP